MSRKLETREILQSYPPHILQLLREIYGIDKNSQRITESELKELIETARTNERVRDEFLKRYVIEVLKIIKKVFPDVLANPYYSIEELITEALLAVSAVLDSVDLTTKEYSIKNYIRGAVINRLRRLLRKEYKVYLGLKSSSTKEKVRRYFAKNYPNVEPTHEDVLLCAKEFDMAQFVVVRALREIQDEMIDPFELEEMLKGDESDFKLREKSIAILDTIWKVIKTDPNIQPSHKEWLYLYYVQELTTEEIANRFGVTNDWVNKKRREALQIIFTHVTSQYMVE